MFLRKSLLTFTLSAIKLITKCSSFSQPRQWLSIPCRPVVHSVLTSLNIFKVKAHNGIQGNGLADFYAKEIMRIALWHAPEQDLTLDNLPFILFHKGDKVEDNPRKFVKRMALKSTLKRCVLKGNFLDSIKLPLLPESFN